jgi:hypothetical protein
LSKRVINSSDEYRNDEKYRIDSFYQLLISVVIIASLLSYALYIEKDESI